jgi:hypothetical protein
VKTALQQATSANMCHVAVVRSGDGCWRLHLDCRLKTTSEQLCHNFKAHAWCSALLLLLLLLLLLFQVTWFCLRVHVELW